ncbi:major capsid protein, partial [uncultured Bilophila sp.]
PIKVKIAVTASELNDLRVIMNDATAVAAWRSAKLEQIRRTIRLTTEAFCSTVLTTGSLTWPKQLEGGRRETYSIDYGDPLTHTLGTKLAADSKISDVYDLLIIMEEKIQMAGVGGSADFWCGKDVFKALMDMVQGYRSTADQRMIKVELGAGWISIGGYVIHVLNETYPDPEGQWVPKLNTKTLMAVAKDVPGTIWYCALDSISANLAALPMHIVPIQSLDDSSLTLIAQSKPVPVRPPKATCLCVAVA